MPTPTPGSSRSSFRSERGGASAENIFLLLNEAATGSRVRSVFDTILAKPRRNDTVVVFIAMHGTVNAGNGSAYLLAYNTDPQELGATAISVNAIQQQVKMRAPAPARLIVFTDVPTAARSGRCAAHQSMWRSKALATRKATSSDDSVVR